MVEKTSQMVAIICKSSSCQPRLITSSVINLNQWYFVSFVLSGTTGYIYFNGSQVGNGTLNVPNNIQRTRNYIGKSNFASSDANADAIYDEIKIYQVALAPAEIINEYQISSNNNSKF